MYSLERHCITWSHSREWHLLNSNWLPSVPWYCWLGVRKSIRPVKIEWRGVGVVIQHLWSFQRLWSYPAPLNLRPYGAIQICLLLLLLLSVWSEVQIVCIWSSWCHCHPKIPSSLASFKSRLVLPFWYQLTHVVLERKGKGSPHSITERRVPELIPVLGSQPAGDVIINPTVGCHYFPSGLQLPPQPL